MKLTENEETIGYDVVDIFSGKKQAFLRIFGNNLQQKIGKYYINTEGLNLGISALQLNSFASPEVIVIDEIGKLELAGDGWHAALQKLVQHFNGYLLLSVRKEVVNEVIEQYHLNPKKVLEVSQNTCNKLYEMIIKNQ